jgi:hypothetical protein
MFKKILGYTKHLTFDPQSLETDPEQENRARIVCTMPRVHQPNPRSKLYNRTRIGQQFLQFLTSPSFREIDFTIRLPSAWSITKKGAKRLDYKVFWTSLKSLSRATHGLFSFRGVRTRLM